MIWPQDMQDDPMTVGHGAEDDFSKFLDLDTDFQFGGLDNGNSGIDTPMGRLAFGGHHSQQPTPHDMRYNGQPLSLDLSGNPDPMSFGNQQFQPFQQQYHPVQMPHGYNVPPTPVSSEMQAAKYGQQIDGSAQLMFERQQVSFTPLVSPAQTPLTHAYSMPQYGTADDFFSPLTSPAIEAQQAFSSARTTASPIDLSAEGVSKPTSAPRTRRRKNSTATRPNRSVKQSPVVKPQARRRKASLTNIAPEKLSQLISHANQQMRQTGAVPSHVLPGTADNSGDSVSPEPLSEALMRPPPVPAAERSPAGLVPSQDNSGNGVTPSALMSMPNKPPTGKSIETPTIHEDRMEDIMLPDAAAPVPLNAAAGAPGRISSDNDATPTLAAKAAKTSAQSTPRGMLPRSVTSDGFSKPSKDSRPGSGRGSKKRSGTTNGTISPALRPKISPSISPLVPSSGEFFVHSRSPMLMKSGPGMSHLSAETSALYLASKSNYQNIIDGTHLPGVSYPEALAENLSSKRTSHKIAEQGRRNRINLALKEIEALLPPDIMSPTIKKEKENESASKSAAAQGASKASTVEMAIVHIKNLQTELEETKAKLAMAEKKLSEGGSSAGSQVSD